MVPGSNDCTADAISLDAIERIVLLARISEIAQPDAQSFLPKRQF